jgi:aspartyl-tRNA(Asn)/glutamyl-tRNA(Gln) amidotransferase subunit C
MPEVVDISHIANLARLGLDEKAKEKLAKEFASIVSYVELLKEVDVSGIEPTAHAAPLANILREDAARPSFTREAMLANAPENIDNELIKVKQVLPGEGMS